MKKIWDTDNFWDIAFDKGGYGRYYLPFRIIDSDGNIILAKGNVHHLKAAFDEYLWSSNPSNIHYPYVVVDTSCKNMMEIWEKTGIEEWRSFFGWCNFSHDH